jgi:hypothetical protein
MRDKLQEALNIISGYINNGEPLPPRDDPYWKADEAIEILRAAILRESFPEPAPAEQGEGLLIDGLVSILAAEVSPNVAGMQKWIDRFRPHIDRYFSALLASHPLPEAAKEPCGECSIIKSTDCDHCGPPAWEGYIPLNAELPEAAKDARGLVDAIAKLYADATHCPNCPDQGWFVGGATDDPEQEQCEYCYTVETSYFNIKEKVRELLEAAIRYARAALATPAEGTTQEGELDTGTIEKAMGHAFCQSRECTSCHLNDDSCADFDNYMNIVEQGIEALAHVATGGKA